MANSSIALFLCCHLANANEEVSCAIYRIGPCFFSLCGGFKWGLVSSVTYVVVNVCSDLKASESGSRDALSQSHRMSSYTDVQPPPPLQVRVYKRSTETLAMLDERRRAQSLPRGMELNRSVASDLQTSLAHDSVSGTGRSSRAASRKTSARSSVASISAFKGRVRRLYRAGP